MSREDKKGSGSLAGTVEATDLKVESTRTRTRTRQSRFVPASAAAVPAPAASIEVATGVAEMPHNAASGDAVAAPASAFSSSTAASGASAHKSVSARHVRHKIPGLTYEPIPGNGHCLFNAIAIHTGQAQDVLRNDVATYIELHIEEFREQIEAINQGRTAEEYLTAVRSGAEWADNLEIATLMTMLDRPIVVIGPSGEVRNTVDLDRFGGEPIFVYFNGHNHYDGYLLQEEWSERSAEILTLLLSEHSASDDSPSPLALGKALADSSGSTSSDETSATARSSVASMDSHFKADMGSLLTSSTASVHPTSDYSHSASPRTSDLRRHTGQYKLSKLKFDAYLSRTDENCLYTAIYESLKHQFEQFPDHSIQLVGSVLRFQAELAAEIDAHRTHYLDDIVVEIIKALRKNQLGHFSSSQQGEINRLVQANKLLLNLVKSAEREREAYVIIRKYLEEDGGLGTYCDWIRASRTSMSEAALKAASRLYQANFFIYHRETLKRTHITDPSYPSLYIQQEYRKYYQLVPEIHARDQLVLPFFNVEPEISGFSPNPPRYHEDLRRAQAQQRIPLEPHWSAAGKKLGQRFYELAKRAVLRSKTDPFGFYARFNPLSPLDLLKSFVADVSSQEKIARKKLLLDRKREQGELSIEQHKRILQKKHDLLSKFLDKKPAVGKILTSQELARQLEVQAQSTLEATLGQFDASLVGSKTHWIGGRELSVAEARQEFRQILREKMAEYQKLDGSFRRYEYVSPADRRFYEERLKAKTAVGPENYYAEHVHALASDTSAAAAMPTLADEQARVRKQLLQINQDLEHFQSVLQSYSDIKAAFDARTATVIPQELPKVLASVQRALAGLVEIKMLDFTMKQAIEDHLGGIQKIVENLVASQSAASSVDSSTYRKNVSLLLKAADLAAKYRHELMDAILLLDAVKKQLSNEDRYTLIAHHLADIDYAPEAAWMNPLTLEEIRVRFMLFLDRFIEEGVLAHKDSKTYHSDFIEYDRTAGRFFKRKKEDAAAIGRMLDDFRSKLTEILRSYRDRVDGWNFDERTPAVIGGVAKKLSAEDLARNDLARVNRKIESLRKIVMHPAGDLDAYLQTLMDQFVEDATLAKNIRHHVILGDEGCQAVYGPAFSMLSVISALLKKEALPPKETSLNEIDELQQLARFNPGVSQEELSFLLEHGLSPDACDAEGMTLLHHLLDGEASSYDEELISLAEYLFKCMASVDVIDFAQRSAGGIVNLQVFFFKNYGPSRAYDIAHRVMVMCEQAHLRRQLSYEYALMTDHFVTKERDHLFGYDKLLVTRNASFFASLTQSPRMTNERTRQRSALGEMTDGLEVSPHEAPLLVPRILDMTAKANKGFLATVTLGLINGSQLLAPTTSTVHEFADTHSYARMVMAFHESRRAYRQRLEDELRRGRRPVVVSALGDLVRREELDEARAETRATKENMEARIKALEAMVLAMQAVRAPTGATEAPPPDEERKAGSGNPMPGSGRR